ncbi:hypothetical protein C8R42DRAFT_638861 [Lentinula raphanica]|nr:hypothetical protein C8R42DRAFT_638861 [Lentinula raphanica]
MHLSTIVVSAIAASAVCALPLQDLCDPNTSSNVVGNHPDSNVSGAPEISLYRRGNCWSGSNKPKADPEKPPAAGFQRVGAISGNPPVPGFTRFGGPQSESTPHQHNALQDPPPAQPSTYNPPEHQAESASSIRSSQTNAEYVDALSRHSAPSVSSGSARNLPPHGNPSDNPLELESPEQNSGGITPTSKVTPPTHAHVNRRP